jgi:glycosyltransferase involved in cell wall biosynthesis
MTTRSDGHPSVTVVVPTRNRPQLLARALTSILQQDYAGPIECIVVFDQSLPDLPPGLVVPPGRTLRSIRNTRKPGLPGARNSGILSSSGELIAFCDDDDEWLPTKLSEQVPDLVGSTDHFVATTGIVTVMEGISRERVLEMREVPHEMFLTSRVMEVHSSTLLIRRAALLDGIGLLDEDIPGGYAEDYDWLLRASRHAPVLVTRAPLVRVLIHRDSYFSEQWEMIADASRYMLERHPDLRTSRRGLARFYGRLALAEAAQGHRRRALRYAAGSLRLQRRQHRAYTAILLSLGVLTPDRAIRLANLLKRMLSPWAQRDR